VGRIRDLAEGLWDGSLDPAEKHPFASFRAPDVTYASEWAQALRTMAMLPAETLGPGHGPPIFGRARACSRRSRIRRRPSSHSSSRRSR
jgi:hypothetical protein